MYKQIFGAETKGKRVERTYYDATHLIQLYYDKTFFCIEIRDFLGPYIEEKQLSPFDSIWNKLIALGVATRNEIDEERKSCLR